MFAQQSLTFLFNAIALSFIAIATIELSQDIIKLYQQVFVAPQQPPSANSHAQVLPQLPDPWLLPIETIAAPADRDIQQQPKPVLLLAPARTVDNVELSANRAISKELLRDINVDTLKLRAVMHSNGKLISEEAQALQLNL